MWILLFILLKIKLGECGAKLTGEAEGTKTRGAAETSSEVTHVPDPLHLTVDGEAREPISPATAVPAIWGIKLRESMSTRKARKAARISDGQLDRGGSGAGGGEDRRDWQASELI